MLCTDAVLYVCKFICECGHKCECAIINTLPGAEEERLRLQSNYDAVQTVKFMNWILLKAGRVINSPTKKIKKNWWSPCGCHTL